jgi:hypothetical protein
MLLSCCDARSSTLVIVWIKYFSRALRRSARGCTKP